MRDLLEIEIWDLDVNRLYDVDRVLRICLAERGLKAKVTSMSEPPLIMRSGLVDRLPVLRIEGNDWNLPPGTPLTPEACRALLNILCPECAKSPDAKTEK